MLRRIFIAVNLPEEIKEGLLNYQKSWPTLPVRWTKKENLHITLVFIGSVKEEGLQDMLNKVKETALKNKSFELNLTKIFYGPPKKMPPRMVWVEGEKSEELGNLQNELENSLLYSSLRGKFKPEKRAFCPHITLGRIKAWEFRKIDPEERPEINESISLKFKVNSIEVMESKLKRTGAEYTVLQSFNLIN